MALTGLRKKKISEDGEITPILIPRAVEEVFVRKVTRMRVN